jgi:insertion element IS1 protein InsB
MYLEGLGFHSTGRLLEVSHVTVMNRVRGYGSEPGSIRNSKPVCIMKLDEMHSCVGRKKTPVGLDCADREARGYIDFVVGDRSAATGRKLWEKVRRSATGTVAPDHWKSYNEFVPKEQPVQTKAETCTMESYNGQIRHFPARFRRKTKCYSKSTEMMTLSLMLLMAKRNKLISIQTY